MADSFRKVLRAVATVLAAVVAGAGWFAVGSAPAGVAGAQSAFYEAKVLEPAASFVARKPVRVWCATSAKAWKTFGGDFSSAHGLTVPGSAVTHFDAQTCPPLRQAVSGKAAYVALLAATIEVLTHEAIHMRGERDEGITDCAAVHEMPRVAVLYFSIKAGRQLRALMAATWAWRDKLPAAYRATC